MITIQHVMPVLHGITKERKKEIFIGRKLINEHVYKSYNDRNNNIRNNINDKITVDKIKFEFQGGHLQYNIVHKGINKPHKQIKYD